MYSILKNKSLFRSFAFRLALAFAVLFGLGSAVTLLLMYGGIYMHLRNEIDAELQGDLQEFSQKLAIYNYDNDALRDIFIQETKEEGADRKFYRLVSEDSRILASSDTSSWPEEALAQSISSARHGGENSPETIQREKDRKARIISGRIGEGKFLQIGIALDQDEQFLSGFRHLAGIILVGMLALGTIIGWRMARKAMSGVEKVTVATERIAGGHFDERVNVEGFSHEIETLSITFNRMAEKIQTLLHEMSQVNNSIAHDLRSPIARIRVLTETIAAQNTEPSPHDSAVAGIVENCDRLTSIIDTMLNIAEIEAGAAPMEMEEINVEDIVKEAYELFLPVAEEKNIAFSFRVESNPAILGDKRKIQRSVANLVDNALKYTDSGGEIVISLAKNGEAVSIGVQDTGIGIDLEDKGRIFERFYRSDNSRTQPGNGLGLSLARSIARAHGGDIAVESAPGSGSTFTFTLPLEIAH